MKLISFSVSNYRSITRAHKIKIHDLTILVGKNNEGKSNIIKAISLSMNIIKKYSYFPHRRPMGYYKYLDNGFDYVWQRDFPVSSQNKKKGSKNTVFELEFLLTEQELDQFNKFTKSRLSTSDFIIIIEIGEDNFPKLKVSKKGTSKLNSKVLLINEFVAKNIVFNYIPAIRTESQAIDLIRDNLAQELKVVENNPEYINAINTINRLQREPLNGIAKKVQETLTTFIPSIQNVKIDIEENIRKSSLRRAVEVSIDDGVLTNIDYKGDGIKSLATLAMLTDRYNVEQSSIIAIDEPEAHLHPGSIRQLNNILQGLVKDNQVIIATHNQLFINKKDIKSNIIVSSGKASPAKSIKEIRDVLGVKLADNLISCNYKLFVEGVTDKKIVEALLYKIPKVKNALVNNEISIEALGGASKLLSKLYESNNTIFDYYVLLDDDESGHDAYEKAKAQSLIDPSKTTFTKCIGKSISEFEDLLKPEIYIDTINSKYGMHLKQSDFNSMKKWSEQLRICFLTEGKPWDDDLEAEIKELVADTVCDYLKNNDDIFIQNRMGPINSFLSNIELLIGEKN